MARERERGQSAGNEAPRGSACAAALTFLPGLLQEAQQDGGCLLRAQLLCVLTPGLCWGRNQR